MHKREVVDKREVVEMNVCLNITVGLKSEYLIKILK